MPIRSARPPLSRPRIPFLCVLVLVLAAGCGEDFFNPSGETFIEGTITIDRGVDPTQPPIFDLGVGLVYRDVAGKPGGLRAAPSQDGVTLLVPYPNPVTAPESVPATVRVEAAAATGARVEIWSTVPPFDRAVASLEETALAAGLNTFTWNGTEAGIGDRVPNGRYLVRVTMPADPPPGSDPVILEESLILNRPLVEVIATDAFNTFTDDIGFYRILDVAVGEPFTGADTQGTLLGNRRLDDRVTLFTCDIDFRHFETLVRIAPGERKQVDIPLIPTASAAPEPAAGGEGETP